MRAIIEAEWNSFRQGLEEFELNQDIYFTSDIEGAILQELNGNIESRF